VSYSVGQEPAVPDLQEKEICDETKVPLDDDWDSCKLLECSKCQATEGCGFCRASYGKWDYSGVVLHAILVSTFVHD
jgi:hypothetical protein